MCLCARAMISTYRNEKHQLPVCQFPFVSFPFVYTSIFTINAYFIIQCLRCICIIAFKCSTVQVIRRRSVSLHSIAPLDAIFTIGSAGIKIATRWRHIRFPKICTVAWLLLRTHTHVYNNRTEPDANSRDCKIYSSTIKDERSTKTK